MGSLFIWWLTVLACGLLAFPLAFVLFRHLPDKGYVLSKPLALLLTGYVSWLTGHLMPGPSSILLALALLVLLSGWMLWARIREPFLKFLGENFAFLLVLECLFFTAFLVAGAYKMRTPDIVGTEKPMDFAFINGILASPTMPPQDPWLSGGSISYYYFGYYIVAMLCRMTGVASGEAFNLGVVLAWALAFACAFSLVYALTRRYRYSLLSALALAILGNLDYWHRAVQSFQVGDLRAPYYNSPADPSMGGGLGAALGFLFSPLQRNWDYFQASRIIPIPPGDKMINEFPSFSFFLSDLHPHVMAIPFVILVLALLYNLLKSPLAGMEVFGGGKAWGWILAAVTALALGGLSFLNSWDFLTLLLLAGFFLALQQGWASREDLPAWGRSLLAVGLPVVAAAFLFYFPFYAKFQSQADGLGFVKDRTGLYHLAVLFGLFLVAVVPSLWGLAARAAAPERGKGKRPEGEACSLCGREGKGRKFCGHCGGEMAPPPFAEVQPLPLEGLQGAMARVARSLTAGPAPFRGWILLALILGALLLLNLPPIRLGVLAFAGLMAFLCLGALAARSETKEMTFTLGMALMAFLLLLGCEVLFIRDHFSSGSLYRMNTVFKFHYQVWILLSLASGPLLLRLLQVQWPAWPSWKKGTWLAGAVLVLMGSAMYPALAFTSKIRSAGPSGSSLDGSYYYQRAFPSDYQAAQWIKENVHPTRRGPEAPLERPVILEAWGGSYRQEYARIATLTGYPTLLGWDFHEAQWRGSWDKALVRGGRPDDTVLRRQADVDAIYTSEDLERTRGLLRHYGVHYVYVGGAERLKYKDRAQNLDKFQELGSVAWRLGDSILYKVGP